jgi:hypothetical protein
LVAQVLGVEFLLGNVVFMKRKFDS